MYLRSTDASRNSGKSAPVAETPRPAVRPQTPALPGARLSLRPSSFPAFPWRVPAVRTPSLPSFARHRHRPCEAPGSGTSSAPPPVRAEPNEPIIDLLQAETIRLKLCVFFEPSYGPLQPLIEQLLEQVSMTPVRQHS